VEGRAAEIAVDFMKELIEMKDPYLPVTVTCIDEYDKIVPAYPGCRTVRICKKCGCSSVFTGSSVPVQTAKEAYGGKGVI